MYTSLLSITEPYHHYPSISSVLAAHLLSLIMHEEATDKFSEITKRIYANDGFGCSSLRPSCWLFICEITAVFGILS